MVFRILSFFLIAALIQPLKNYQKPIRIKVFSKKAQARPVGTGL